MKDKLYKKLFKEQKSKSPKQVIAEMILRRQCDHKREGKKGEKPNWETYNVTENGEAKTMAVCSNPLCACSKKKDAICLDPLDPEEIKEHAKYMINVFEVLKINNLSLAEFGVLLYFADRKNTKSLEDLSYSLWEKGYLTKEVENYSFEVHSFEKLQTILAESTNEDSVNKRAEELADKLRNIYPKGKIPNTNYYYKSNKSDIINKLKTFFNKYGVQYTDEQIINATQKYVNSFNGNYTYLKLLKYFIWKDERLKGESVQSLLADFIENENVEDISNSDWTATLR